MIGPEISPLSSHFSLFRKRRLCLRTTIGFSDEEVNEGERRNPLNDMNDLSKKIVMNVAKKMDYDYVGGKNILQIVIKVV